MRLEFSGSGTPRQHARRVRSPAICTALPLHRGTATCSRIFPITSLIVTPFDLVFRAQHEAMAEHRLGQALHVVRRHEIAAGERGSGAAGEQQRLRRARSGADEDAVVLPRRADDIDDVGDEFLAHRDAFERAAQRGQILGGDHRLDRAGGERFLGRVRAEHALRELQFAVAIRRRASRP